MGCDTCDDKSKCDGCPEGECEEKPETEEKPEEEKTDE